MRCPQCGGKLVLERVEEHIVEYNIRDGEVQWCENECDFAEEIETNGLRCKECNKLFDFGLLHDEIVLIPDVINV